MGANSSIEWTDATWNPVRGCSRVSPGCLNCYAEKIAARFSDEDQPFHLFAARKPKPHWTGKVGIVESALDLPLRWRKPRKIFVNSMSDLFHESLSTDDITRVFRVMCGALHRGHVFQILTKRPERMCEQVTFAMNRIYGFCWRMPDQIWLGTSVEDRSHKDRINHLQKTPASVRFLSLEPLLEDIGELDLRFIDQVIVGGESGPGARPFELDWAKSVIDQCKESGVACFVKQAGSNPMYGSFQPLAENPPIPVRYVMKDRKGGNPEEWPQWMRVREFPSPEGSGAGLVGSGAAFFTGGGE